MAIGKLSTKWKVNGIAIYTPSPDDTQIDRESVQGPDSGRTEDGHMHITWVLTDVVKVSIVWDHLTGNELIFLKNLMQGKEFTLTYPDADGIRTVNVYCTSMSYHKVSDSLYAAEGGLYSDISANAIEL
jgi:hypothetical protein